MELTEVAQGSGLADTYYLDVDCLLVCFLFGPLRG